MRDYKRTGLKILLIIVIFAIAILKSTMSKAATTVEPGENNYFELRAVEIKDVEGQGKQVIMELWGYDITFKRI